MKVSQRLDNLNQIVSAPALNKLGIEIPAARTHKQVDEIKAAVIETIEKQGHKYLINDNGTIALVPAKKKKAAPAGPEKKKAEPKVAKEPITADDDTVELIKSVIGAFKAEGEEWYNTGQWIYSRKKSFGTDAKENRKVMYKLLDQSSGGAVPETGISNTGEEITLRKRNGAVKWAAWSETRRWTQYLARIFQAVEAAGWAKVFPKGQLVSKDDINELLKKPEGPGEDPHKTFIRSVELAAKKVADSDPQFIDEMQTALDELNAAFAELRKNSKK